MKHLALIGYPLQHSFSKKYFERLFKDNGITYYDYSLLELTVLDGIKEIVAQHLLCGFNITAPFKQQIIPHLDNISAEAQTIGAVNCVRIKNNKWYGYNTDWQAFMQTLNPWTDRIKDSLALILGTGGAARAVAYALRKMNIEYRMVSRWPSKDACFISYDAAKQLMQAQHTLLVNATPIGMYPHIDASPWPYMEIIDKCTLVYDLIYNPSQTLLLRAASSANIPICNGLDMLHIQADYSWKIFQL